MAFHSDLPPFLCRLKRLAKHKLTGETAATTTTEFVSLEGFSDSKPLSLF